MIGFKSAIKRILIFLLLLSSTGCVNVRTLDFVVVNADNASVLNEKNRLKNACLIIKELELESKACQSSD